MAAGVAVARTTAGADTTAVEITRTPTVAATGVWATTVHRPADGSTVGAVTSKPDAARSKAGIIDSPSGPRSRSAATFPAGSVTATATVTRGSAAANETAAGSSAPVPLTVISGASMPTRPDVTLPSSTVNRPAPVRSTSR